MSSYEDLASMFEDTLRSAAAAELAPSEIASSLVADVEDWFNA